jgi:hypothetical protein
VSFIKSKSSVKLILSALVIAAAGGLLIRLAPFSELQINLYNLRQAHSHLAFLGWVFSALIWLIDKFVIKDLFASKAFRVWFFVEFAISNLIFVAFILFGYSRFSIALLSIHTLIAYWGIVKIFRKSADVSTRLRLPLRLGLIGFIISSIGPILIPLIQKGVIFEGQSIKIGINFYLHFHYNAWFIFSIISILIAYLDSIKLLALGNKFHMGLTLMFLSLFVSYFDSLFWLDFSEWTEYVFFLNSSIQLIGFYMVVMPMLKQVIVSVDVLHRGSKFMLMLIMITWESKYLFELIVNLPYQEWFNVANHFLQIAYLHWVFLGIVTPFVIYLFQELKMLPKLKVFNMFFWGGWIGTELLLISLGIGIMLPDVMLWIAVYSALMFVAFSSLLFSRK